MDMASVTRQNDGKAMIEQQTSGDGGGRDDKPSGLSSSRDEKHGFFTIHKKGQGYWTRMGTVFAAILVGALAAHFLYEYVPAWFGPTGIGLEQKVARQVGIGVTGGFVAIFSLLMFWIMNKPYNVDFLIATDSEMKKVNWTSRRELIGSTKVVILFMFLIAAILFGIDIVFGYVFHWIKVLETSPFG